VLRYMPANGCPSADHRCLDAFVGVLLKSVTAWAPAAQAPLFAAPNALLDSFTTRSDSASNQDRGKH